VAVGYRPNWYDDDTGRARSYWLGAPSHWSGVRWILTLTIGVFILQLFESNVFHTGWLTEWGALRAWEPPTREQLALGGDLRFNPWFPVQLVTYALLHGGLWHIFFNMLFLVYFGPELEGVYGRASFLRMYVGGAVAGGLLQWLWYLLHDDPGNVIGASGAVFAVTVLFAIRWPNRVLLIWGILPAPVWALVGFLLLGNIIGFLGGPADTATSVLAHLGGAAYGLLWYRWGDVLQRAAQRRRREKTARVLADTDADRREMDRILGKIQTSGLSSLDPRERTFLERRSRELREQGR
jgi:membrane associated rhomboid family serine protease